MARSKTQAKPLALSQSQYGAVCLLIILLAKAVAVYLLISASFVALSPDEAQYWVWSRDLSYGYYSKPPGIAWQIALTTAFCGQAELGVRLGALFFSVGSAFALYRLALFSGLSVKASFWSALVLALSPVGFYGSLAATTDGGLSFFWIIALAELVKRGSKSAPDYGKLGLWILLGALFKWHIYLIWPLVFCLLLAYPKWRNKTLFGGLLLSLLGLLPSIIWNANHDWVTFRHIFQQIQGGNESGNTLEFFGAQVGLFSPVFFGLFVYGLFKKRSKGPLVIWAITSAALFIFYLAFSFFHKIQPNWMIYAYPTMALLVGWAAQDRGGWLVAGTALSLTLVFILLGTPYAQSHNWDRAHPIPYKYNALQQCLGWQNLPEALQEAGYDQQKHFLFADKYQMTSLLSFYSKGQKRAYFLNIRPTRKNQFSFYPTLAQEQLGKDGFYVVDWNRGLSIQEEEQLKVLTIKNLNPYFSHVFHVATAPLFQSYDLRSKGVMIFFCTHYNGHIPKELNSY